MRKNPKIQNTVVMDIAPKPTAPIIAASPNWPTTPVSTKPKSGTVMFDKTTGTAMRNTRAWVKGGV
jgi:hypothetical protein